MTRVQGQLQWVVCWLLFATACGTTARRPTEQPSAEPAVEPVELALPARAETTASAGDAVPEEASAAPAAPKKSWRLVFHAPVAHGALTAGQLATFLEGKASELMAACESEVSGPATLRLGLSVVATGRVEQAVLLDGADDALGQCVNKQLSAWAFPKSGGPTRIMLPLEIYRGDGSASTGAKLGRLSGQKLASFIVSKRAEVARRCMQSMPEKDTAARVILQLNIAADGTVVTVHSQGDVPALMSCVEKQARAWRFPASSEATTVRVPLLFKSKP